MDLRFQAGIVVADPGSSMYPLPERPGSHYTQARYPLPPIPSWICRFNIPSGGGHCAVRPDLSLVVANAAGRLWDNRIANGLPTDLP